ncbi:hypothetical protein BOX15_Mlig023822g1, partial [Macrostomum lignano]
WHKIKNKQISMAQSQLQRRDSSIVDSDSNSDSDNNSSYSSDEECRSPVAKRVWLGDSSKGNSISKPSSVGLASSSRLAAAEAWRKTFQEGVIDSQLSRAVGFVSGGQPNVDRDTEAYNYKLAPRLPDKESRQAKRKADLDAISAAVAAAGQVDDEFSAVAEQHLELEQFGLPSADAQGSDSQSDLRLKLQAKNRKRNAQKRLSKERKRQRAEQRAAGGNLGDMEVDGKQKAKRGQRDRNKLDPSVPPEKLARRLAHLLHEPKRHILDRVVAHLGPAKAIELYRRTQDIESAGGLRVANGNRRRTPGGVYMQLIKSEDSVTPDMLRQIFDGEQSSAKDRRKRLRANRRKKQSADRGGVVSADAQQAAETAELEKKRAELLAQLDSLEDADVE